MMVGESDADELADGLGAEQRRLYSAVCAWEAIAGLCRAYKCSVPSARAEVQSFIDLNDLQLVPIGTARTRPCDPGLCRVRQGAARRRAQHGRLLRLRVCEGQPREAAVQRRRPREDGRQRGGVKRPAAGQAQDSLFQVEGYGSSDADRREEGVCASVVSGCGAAPVVRPGEHVLDPVPLPVEHLVIGDRQLSVLGRRNAGCRAALRECFAEPVAVVAAICNQARGLWQRAEHNPIAGVVTRLAFGEQQYQWSTFAIADRVQL